MKVKRKDLFQLHQNLVQCELTGRKFTDYLYSNMVLVNEKIKEDEEKFRKDYPHYFTPENQEKIKLINNKLITARNPQTGEVPEGVISKIAMENADEYKIFKEQRDMSVVFGEQEVEVEFEIVPKRFVPKEITLADRMKLSFCLYND